VRRLDSLELERAIVEIGHLVDEGKLTGAEALPVMQAFSRQCVTDEARELFDQSCLTRSREITITIVDIDADDALPFGQEDPAEDEDESLLFDEE
jgi:hypothetical protein